MSDDIYQFQFNANRTAVRKMYELDDGEREHKKVSGFDFELQEGENDRGEIDIVAVGRSRESRGEIETTIYTDQDGDGDFIEWLELTVATDAVPARRLEQHQFRFDDEGNVTADFELSRGRWKQDRIEHDEDYSLVQLDGVDYVLKREQERDGVEFALFRDDNQDGIWTQVAEGEVADPHWGQDQVEIDLLGLAPYLQQADTLVG